MMRLINITYIYNINSMIKFARSTSSLLRSIKYTFIPPSCYDILAKPNPVVCVTLGNDSGAFCDLHFRLFENTVPRTAQNYKQLLLGSGKYKGNNLTLVGAGITRHIQRSFIQFGKIGDENCSIFGPKFRDQSFELLHDRPGLLTSISEQNTNNSRFAITLSPCPFMDLKNVVFGQVTSETFGNLRELQKLGSTLPTIRILSSQLLKIPDDHHGHEHHGVQECPDPDKHDPHPGHHGLKHKHDHH